MVILILIMFIQYSLKAVFSFEKGLNLQSHSSLVSLYPIKKIPQ